MSIKEEAPTNATGTAVAGTGDDSSTVVVKKKKKKEDDYMLRRPMADRLIKKFKIKETLDKLIPDLEYPKDEVRERTNQLKQLALGEAFTSQQIKQAYGILNDPRYKGGNYDGAVAAIEKLAKGLSKHPVVANALRRANEDMDRQPQDKDVKSKPGTQPKKYYKKMSKSDKEKRAAHFAKQKYKKSDDDDDYKAAPGDKGAKTKPSIHTKKFKQMYGENLSLEEAIKGLQNKAKKTGMPYSILKKVYDRGMAAWKGGHRPGATQQQWAFARVNSFVTKSSGTWGGADKDLAAKVRGSK